jgi:hypothetical protein
MPGRRFPHTAAAMEVAHPVDTILRVPLAVAIGAAMALAMVMAGAVAQLVVLAAWAGAVTVAIGEPLLPAVEDTTMALAAAAADTTTPLAAAAAAAAVTGRRAALRAVGTRISG